MTWDGSTDPILGHHSHWMVSLRDNIKCIPAASHHPVHSIGCAVWQHGYGVAAHIVY